MATPLRRTQSPLPHRVPRSRNPEIREDNESLWAISYADFLMVLLAFFVLFFSVDDKEKHSIIQTIVDSQFKNQKVDGTSPPAGVYPLTDVKTALAGLELSVDKEGERLKILLPDNIFAPGRFEIKQEAKSSLLQILRRLEPYKEIVDIMIVGHADASPMTNQTKNVIRDNFDLSSLRATRALQEAVRLGFHPSQLSARGSAEFGRESRTLSFVITAKGDSP